MIVRPAEVVILYERVCARARVRDDWQLKQVASLAPVRLWAIYDVQL